MQREMRAHPCPALGSSAFSVILILRVLRTAHTHSPCPQPVPTAMPTNPTWTRRPNL